MAKNIYVENGAGCQMKWISFSGMHVFSPTHVIALWINGEGGVHTNVRNMVLEF